MADGRRVLRCGVEPDWLGGDGTDGGIVAMKHMLDVFRSSNSPVGHGPFLVVRYGERVELPAEPSDGRWTYVATVRSDLDALSRIGPRGMEALTVLGFHLTWQSPI